MSTTKQRMAAKRDYYEVLSVERTVTVEIIKRSYKKLARQYHPDRNPDDPDAAERFKECAEAYEVLSDPEKRQRYDRYGHDGVRGSAGSADAADIFNDIFGSFFGGGGGRSRSRSRRGRDVNAQVSMTLAEAAVGATREVTFKRSTQCGTCDGSGAKPGTQPATCDYCGGAGQVIQSQGFFRVQSTCPACRGAGKMVKDACPDCRGSGRQPEEATEEIKIPAGIDDGMQLCVRGAGEASADGGSPGDLYVEVQVEPHPLYERQGSHLIVQVPVSYTQAALGATIEVPSLDGGALEIEIPAGTQPGETFRRRGEGLPDPRGGARGHLHVEVRVEVPMTLDAEHERLLRQLAELEDARVTPERRSFFDTIKGLFAGEA